MSLGDPPHVPDARASRPIHAQTRLQWVSLAAAALLSVLILVIQLPGIVRYHTPDLHPYSRAAAAILHGTDLYANAPGTLKFTYPPFAALAFLPLRLFSFHAAGAIVTGISLVALFVVVLVSLAMASADHASSAGGSSRVSGWAPAVAVFVFAAALLLEPVQGTLHYGQVNLVLLALVLVDLWRPQGRLPRGVLIGLAAAVKLTPGIFIVYFLLTRRVKEALVASATFVIAALFALAFTPHASRLYWTSLIFKLNRVGVVRDARNQSLYGALARLQGSAHHAHGLWFVAALAAACLGLGVAALLSRRGHELWGVCACGITGVLISPISWDHHWVWAVPCLVALGLSAWRSRSWALAVATIAWWTVFFLAPFWWVMPEPLLWRQSHTLVVVAMSTTLATAHRLSLVSVLANSYVLAGIVLLGGLSVWMAVVRASPPSRADPSPPHGPT